MENEETERSQAPPWIRGLTISAVAAVISIVVTGGSIIYFGGAEVEKLEELDRVIEEIRQEQKLMDQTIRQRGENFVPRSELDKDFDRLEDRIDRLERLFINK